ncbi:VCBS domain-containing protein, partial [Oleiphilus sp. HI0067]
GSQQGQYGVISLDASGKWVYQLDPAKAESLAKGETAQETFQVEVLDQHGERSVAQIRVEVVGSNDLPSVAPVVQQSVAENATTPISGTLQVIDPDVSDQHAWRSVNTSQYGQFSLNAQTGAWEYRLNTAHPDVQKLLTGQTLKESIIVEVDDGLGGTATQTIAIEIDGQGNAPVAVIDNSHLNAGGIDTGNVFANDQADTSLTLTGINGQSLQFDPVSGWSQVFDTGHALVQFKANGSFEAQAKTGNSNLQTVTESLQYEAQDQSGVTATGSMDVHTDAAQQVIAPPPPPLAPVSADVPAVSYDSDPLLLLDQVTAPSGKSEATRSSFIQESLVDLAPELEPKESVSDLLSGLPESSNDKDSAGNADTAQTNEQESNRKAGAWDVGHSVNLDSLLP